MKRIVLLMIGCALLASGCARELVSIEEPAAPRHLTIDIVPTIDVPQTRDVKTGWENGDKIYVFFDFQKSASALDYLTMTYDGSKWDCLFSDDALEERLLSGSGGFLSALYFTYGTPTFTKQSGSGSYLLKFGFDIDVKQYAIGYYCCNLASYTVADGHLKAALKMNMMPTDDVQFFIPDIPAERASDYSFSCDAICRRYATTLTYSGTTSSPKVTYKVEKYGSYGKSFKGYPYKGGVVFVGRLSPTVVNESKDYSITITDTKGTSDTSDDITYSFTVSQKKLKYKDAVRLPALNTERWDRPINGHEYVDLGLPSGNLWATMNIDAPKPSGRGSFFAWAETESDGDDCYDWSTYQWIKSGYSSPNYITKYTFRDGDTDGIWYNSSGTFIGDSYKALSYCDYEDDAAAVQWGAPWHTPSHKAFQELMDNTDNYWVDDYDGASGYKFVSKKDASKFIFLPVSGYKVGEDALDESWSGNYWTSSLYTDFSSEDEPASSKTAYEFSFNKTNSSPFFNYVNRCQGDVVRPIMGRDYPAIDVKYVDLGLPSGLKWATCNLSASAPEMYGLYCAWAEIDCNDFFDWAHYMWMDYGCNNSDGINKYTIADNCVTGNWYNEAGAFCGDGKNDLSAYYYEDDAARQILGGSWRIPTPGDFEELIANTDYAYVRDEQDRTVGMILTSKADPDKSIYLPTCGYVVTGIMENIYRGYYWTSTIHNTSGAYAFTFGGSDGPGIATLSRFLGAFIRPVSE